MLHSARSLFDLGGCLRDKPIVELVFRGECARDLVVKREDAIEVLFRLSHQRFNLSWILRRASFSPKISQLILTPTHFLLSDTCSVASIDWSRTSRRTTLRKNR